MQLSWLLHQENYSSKFLYKYEHTKLTRMIRVLLQLSHPCLRDGKIACFFVSSSSTEYRALFAPSIMSFMYWLRRVHIKPKKKSLSGNHQDSCSLVGRYFTSSSSFIASSYRFIPRFHDSRELSCGLTSFCLRNCLASLKITRIKPSFVQCIDGRNTFTKSKLRIFPVHYLAKSGICRDPPSI
jgi:hypothetical protein